MTARVPLTCVVFLVAVGSSRAFAQERSIDTRLRRVLTDNGFTGEIGQPDTLVERLGRDLDPKLVNLGNFLFFDKVLGLHDDHSCAGCHAPINGFGDTQSISIGIQSNEDVSESRTGPRNLRRAPSIINSAFYPTLMWDGRFSAPSGDPFDNSLGYAFPEPEGTTAFPADDTRVTHLLIAQAFLPPTQFEEMAGFTGIAGDGTLDAAFDVFDDGLGATLPGPDASGYRNEPIRQMVVDRINDPLTLTAPADHIGKYKDLFSAAFGLGRGDLIDFTMIATAIAEFELKMVCADAPIDKYARGDATAMLLPQKKGALVFFGKGQCVSCHAVAGQSNEMFSDFKTHVIAAPQIAPIFSQEHGNVMLDGDDQNQDFGLERATGNKDDRYMFRTAPLRNLKMARAFFHDGSVTTIDAAIRHHLNVVDSLNAYEADDAGLDTDLVRGGRGPYEPMVDRLDPILQPGIDLTEGEIHDLVAFVEDALLDEDCVSPETLCALVPAKTPGNDDMEHFIENCPELP